MPDTNQLTAKKIAGLDHLRALAISLVFLFHYRLFAHPQWVDTLCKFGWTGVDLFFVLSGYLIAGQIFKGMQRGDFSLKVFFIKRFLRILPSFWVVLAIYFLIPAAREWEALSPLWKFLTFTQNFGLDQRYNRTFSHAWSLCVEEQFYLLLPLSVLFITYIKGGKTAGYIIAALFLGGIAIRVAGWNAFVAPVTGTDVYGITWYKWLYYPTYNRLDGLLAGISIAGLVCYYPSAKAFIDKYANLLLASGLLLAGVAYMVCLDFVTFNTAVFGFPIVAIAYGCMVASATSARSVLNKFSSKLTAYIATLSYTIYLVHKMTMHLAQEYFSTPEIPADGNLMFVISIIVSVSGAMLLHYIVEKPFLKLKDRLTARREK